MKKKYILNYTNENEFKKLEWAIKKYNILAYKKLYFEYYTALEEGNFKGNLLEFNKENETEKYSLELPPANHFEKQKETQELIYIVHKKEGIIMLDTITNVDKLQELNTYKSVKVSRTSTSNDKFKRNLLNMINNSDK